MNWIQDMDVHILLWIQEYLRSDAVSWFWKAVTFLGNGGWFWIVLAVGLLLCSRTRKIGGTALLSMVIGALITNVILKNRIARPRPFDAFPEITPLVARPTDFSFPSGHTTASFACALVLYRMLPKKYGIPAVCLAFLIAFSRLYVGVHYPTDVLAGCLIGIVSSVIADKVRDRIKPFIMKNKFRK